MENREYAITAVLRTLVAVAATQHPATRSQSSPARGLLRFARNDGALARGPPQPHQWSILSQHRIALRQLDRGKGLQRLAMIFGRRQRDLHPGSQRLGDDDGR